MRHIRITFFGDSICAGEGVALHRGWIPRLSEYLSTLGKELGADVTVTNSGINGDTTRQALLRMHYHVTSKACDILVIQFGMNDCNKWEVEYGVSRVSKNSFIANIQEMIIRAAAAGIRCIIVNTNHPSNSSKDTYDADNNRYNDYIREAVADYVENLGNANVSLLDIGKAFKGSKNFVLSDGVHLSEQGHVFYFDFMKPELEKRLRMLL